MKKLIAIAIFLASFNLFAIIPNTTRNVRMGTWPNNDTMSIFALGAPSVTYKLAPVASTDPFAGKTKKYAESKVIRVTTIDKAAHISFGGATISAADTNDALIPPNSTEYCLIDTTTPYVRIIEATASAFVTVTEVY